MHLLVRRQPRDRQLRLLDAAPVAEPREDEEADRRGDQAGDEERDQELPQPEAGLDQQDPGGERAAEERRDRREGAGHRQDLVVGGVDVDEVRDRQADRRPERDQGRLRAEHGAEGQRAEGRQGHARRVGDGRRRGGAEAVQRAVAAVSGEQPPRGEHERGAGHRERGRTRNHGGAS